MEQPIHNDYMTIKQQLVNSLKGLQKSLASVDLINSSSSNDQGIEFLIARRGGIKLDIRQEKNHKIPHFHILYKQEHNASYKINPIEKLTGDMPKKYEKRVLSWAKDNKEHLSKAWTLTNEKCSPPDPIIIN